MRVTIGFFLPDFRRVSVEWLQDRILRRFVRRVPLFRGGAVRNAENYPARADAPGVTRCGSGRFI